VSLAISRTLTIVAAAVLAFDGAGLAMIGWFSGRLMLVLIGLAFFVSSGLVFLYWRWYRRRLDDIAAARHALGQEVREMQRVLRDR
jgi:uncharacterized membrane protein